MHPASSYEGLKLALEFRSQCCILLFAQISLCSDNGVSDNKPKSKPICLVQHNNNNNNNNNRVPGARGGSEKLDSSNQATTHAGTGEKESLNINVVGKNGTCFIIVIVDPSLVFVLIEYQEANTTLGPKFECPKKQQPKYDLEVAQSSRYR